MASDPPEQEAQEDAAGETPATAENGASEEENYSPDELEDNGSKNTGPPADVDLSLILDVPVDVSLQVGSTEITIRDLVQLVEGSVVALDRDYSEPMDVMVNGTLIAHGEIVVVDEKFGVRLTDVVSPAERIRNIN